jgi:hypothetical protein
LHKESWREGWGCPSPEWGMLLSRAKQSRSQTIIRSKLSWLFIYDRPPHLKHLSGTDKRVKATDKDIANLKRKILKYQPKILALNGKQAAKEFLKTKTVSYGKQNHKLGRTLIWVLPSTSPVAGKYWNIDHWKNLKKMADKL